MSSICAGDAVPVRIKYDREKRSRLNPGDVASNPAHFKPLSLAMLGQVRYCLDVAFVLSAVRQ